MYYLYVFLLNNMYIKNRGHVHFWRQLSLECRLYTYKKIHNECIGNIIWIGNNNKNNTNNMWI